MLLLNHYNFYYISQTIVLTIMIFIKYEQTAHGLDVLDEDYVENNEYNDYYNEESKKELTNNDYFYDLYHFSYNRGWYIGYGIKSLITLTVNIYLIESK
jgi:hypothetical protein